MPDELKPCPWCNGTPYLSLAKEYRSIYGCHDCGRFGPTGENRDEALAKWNTRPIEDALRAENASLNARLEAAQELIKALAWVNEAREYEDDMQNPSTSYMEACDAVDAAREALERRDVPQ